MRAVRGAERRERKESTNQWVSVLSAKGAAYLHGEYTKEKGAEWGRLEAGKDVGQVGNYTADNGSTSATWPRMGHWGGPANHIVGSRASVEGWSQ